MIRKPGRGKEFFPIPLLKSLLAYWVSLTYVSLITILDLDWKWEKERWWESFLMQATVARIPAISLSSFWFSLEHHLSVYNTPRMLSYWKQCAAVWVQSHSHFPEVLGLTQHNLHAVAGSFVTTEHLFHSCKRPTEWAISAVLRLEERKRERDNVQN